MNLTKIGSQNFCSINRYKDRNNDSTISYAANNQQENKSKSRTPIIFTFMLIGAIFVGLLLSAKGNKI